MLSISMIHFTNKEFDIPDFVKLWPPPDFNIPVLSRLSFNTTDQQGGLIFLAQKARIITIMICVGFFASLFFKMECCVNDTQSFNFLLDTV